jgi:hypothetical protein
MEMKQVSDNCFAVLNLKNRVCDANSGLINRGGGVVIDTQSDLPQIAHIGWVPYLILYSSGGKK